MTPPTSAQGSVAVMRRQPAHDVLSSPYFIAQPSQPTRNGLAAENGHKTKKSWGERLKLGGNKTKDQQQQQQQLQQQQLQYHQQQQELANNNYLLHEYRTKYGTLSAGSALSKSMKYAETWLYGTVSNRQSNVLLYHPPPAMAMVPATTVAMCGCPEFVGGTVRTRKNTNSAGICKKCGGSRVLWGGMGTVRAATVRVGHSRSRPSLVDLAPQFKAGTPDPYDLMRRNRLGGDEEEAEAKVRVRARAKSTSPRRHGARSPSPPACRAPRRESLWETEDKRKSILECDVNPYQLIAKYLKNGSVEGEGEGHPGDLDDELSDDLSDNALENDEDVTTSRSTTSFSRRTEAAEWKPTESVEKARPSVAQGVCIGGKRIRMFGGSMSNVSTQEFVDDGVNDDPEIPANAVPKIRNSPVSMIPRLASPKRPQRRPKSSESAEHRPRNTTDQPGQTKDEEIESESLQGESSSSNGQIERRSNLVSSNIKSILKKPSATPPEDTETTTSSLRLRDVRTFNDTIRKPDAAEAQSYAQPRSIGSSNFYLPTFQEYKQQHRKKKQVQFNVQACAEASSAGIAADENVNAVPEITVSAQPLGDGGEIGPRAVEEEEESARLACVDTPMRGDDLGVGKVTGKLGGDKPVKLQYFGDHVEDAGMAVKDKDKDEGVVAMAPHNITRSHTHLNTDMEAEPTLSHVGTVVTLRRSLSDCQASSSDEGVGLSRQEQNATLFNDTMRLRLRAGRRTDSRQAFSHPSDPPSRDKRVVSPGRPRPKEPPPPPPLPAPPDTSPRPALVRTKQQVATPTTNTATTPQKPPSLESLTVIAPPEPPPRQIFPFTKKQIQNINNQKRQVTLKTSQSATLLRDTSRKSRPNSCIPHLPNSLTETRPSPGVSKMRHRNSDPGLANVSLAVAEPKVNDKEDRVSLRDEGRSSFREEGATRTIVTVCPESPDIHRLQIMTEGTFVPKHERKTSILVNGNADIKVAMPIDEIQKNNNKVTINVGGVDGMTAWTNANNTCTIIDTSQSNNNSLTRINPVIIPVSPDPKYANSTSVQIKNDKNHITIIDNHSMEGSKIHHDYEVLELLMDPVEAVKRNLVPHVCGKENPDGGAALVPSSAMERLNSLLSSHKELSETETSGSVIEISSPELSLTDVNRYSSSECSDKTLYKDQENNGISVHYFTSPRFVIGDETAEEKLDNDEDDDDEGLHKDIYDDAENIYESIKDPIYEEIGLPDTPPPLPLSPPPSLDELGDDKRTSRSIFEGASKYDILNYLVDAKERGYVESDYNSSTNGEEGADGKETPQEMTSLGELSSRVSNLSNVSDSSEDSCTLVITTSLDSTASKARKSAADIERNDSGVGSETSKSSRSRWQSIPTAGVREDQTHLCEDCDQPVETQVTDGGVMFAPLVCRKCAKKRAERKETILEIVETEEKYGGDLQIILEEFYRPMLVAGLLTPEQLSAIFLNVEELLENNASLAEKLRDALEIALEQGDEDLLTVNIGRLFLEAAPMLHAFESYCTRQGAASILLANLEKEKELLRIFLRVSQMENAVLRRMNLNSFLMVPVQRVTKYPLLLARLYKVTPAHHEGRELLKQAQHKIELHLEHMNSVAKDISTTRLWRRISIINGRRSSSEIDMINIKLRKMAVDALDWNHDEVKFAMEGRMLYTNPTDNNWRKARTIKLNPINALLVTNGKTSEDYRPEDEMLLFPKKTGVREATLLLLKEKCGRYALLREPLFLDKCIVCSDTEWEDYFEVQELATKDTFIFKAEDSERTKLWYHQLQFHSQGLGAWRRRRNALANIMINGMLTRN